MIHPEPSDVSPYTLTEAGWPRPVIDGWPIPWVTPTERLSEVNEGRRLASVGGAICQVCGLSFGYGDPAYGFCTLTLDGEETIEDLPLDYGDFLSALIPASDLVMLLDGAVLHHRCAKLTAIRCPHVRDRKGLIMIQVPANDAIPKERDDGVVAATYAAGDCMYVSWPDPRRSS